MRSLFLFLAALGAYLLLRGWPEVLHPLMRTCLAVLLFVLGFALWPGRARGRHLEARSARPPGVADYLAVGLGILAIECAFVFLLTVTPPRAEVLAGRLEAYVHPELHGETSGLGAGSGGGEGGANGAGLITGNWLWNQLGRRRLPDRFSATPTDKPEVFLRPLDGESERLLRSSPPYLRAFALERYLDRSWAAGVFASPPGEGGLLRAEEEGIRFPVPPARPGQPVSARLFHPAPPHGQDLFLALQGAVSTDLPELRAIAPGIHRLPATGVASGHDYRTTSIPLTLDEFIGQGTQSRLIPDPEASPHLLELPGDSALRDSILQIAARTQGPLEDRLMALRRFLNANCTYSLTVRNPRGLDPLENFLFHERRGHCEYFATAGALLCRSLGIPARVAYGWSGGRYYSSNRLLLFRAREAHAWTEILLEDVGWVIFDLTPLDARNTATSTIAPADEAPPFQDPDNPFGANEDEAPPAGTKAALILCATLGLAVLTFLLLYLRPRSRRKSVSMGEWTLLPDPPGYFSKFRRASARLGYPMPAGRTLRQHLDALGEIDLAPEFAGDLLDYHYSLTYGDASADRSRERALGRAIKRWRG